MGSRGIANDDEVHLVTSAQKPHSEEISGRARRYLVSMGIRTLCLVLAIFVLHGWIRLVAIAAAIILPWLAVVIANAGPVGDDEQPEFITLSRVEIEPGAGPDAAPTDHRADDDRPADSGAAQGGDTADEQHRASERIGVQHYRNG